MASFEKVSTRPESVLLPHPCLRIEANEVIKEVAYAVKNVELSNKLTNTDEQIYLNIETKEGNPYCVELSVKGFQVVDMY